MLIATVINGAWRGFIMQVCSLVGVAAGIWLGVRYGAVVGGWLHLDQSFAGAVGFLVVVVVVALSVSIAALVIRKAFHFVGFGIPDAVLGMVVGLAKGVLLLSVLCSAFARINADHTLLSAQTVETSKCYKPLLEVSGKIMPLFERIEDRISESDKKTE